MYEGMSPEDLADKIKDLVKILKDKAEHELTGMAKKKRLASMALCGEQVFEPDFIPEPSDVKIANAVHQIFAKYKTNELGQLTEEEVDRFRINFSRCVIGMEPKIAYDPDLKFKELPD